MEIFIINFVIFLVFFLEYFHQIVALCFNSIQAILAVMLVFMAVPYTAAESTDDSNSAEVPSEMQSSGSELKVVKTFDLEAAGTGQKVF